MSLEAEANVPTLYHAQWFCSSIPLQILRELNVPSTKVAVREVSGNPMEALKTDPVLTRISPRRVLPVLVMPDGSTVVEAIAISLWICETFDQSGKLHPLPGHPLRAKFLQGMVYAATEGYKSSMVIFRLCFMVEKKDRNDDLVVKAAENWNEIVTKHLQREMNDGRKYYLGNDFTVADIAFGYLLMTAEFCDADLLKDDFLKAYHARLKERETYQILFTPATS